MSIQSEITRISANVTAALAAIARKGVTVPSGSNSDDLEDLIDAISAGGGSAISIVDELDSHGGTIRHINGVSLEGDTVAADKLLAGYTAHNAQGQPITGTYTPPSPSYQAKTGITPTTSSQTITPDSGYDALSSVQISPIPSQYIIPSGNKEITENGDNIDVSNYATVSVNVPSAGDSVDTKTVTASNYPVSIQFTGMKGRPKYFFLRSTSQMSSSGSTTYYYIVDMRYDGTNTTGNCFRIGSTRRVDNITSGYSWTYSGTTLTITSSAASRSASPGAFNNTYELVYIY